MEVSAEIKVGQIDKPPEFFEYGTCKNINIFSRPDRVVERMLIPTDVQAPHL